MNRAIAAAALIALAGCHKPSVDERNASVEDVASAVAKSDGAGLKFTPGRWEAKLKFLEMKAPGMPPEVARSMQSMLGKDRSYATCLSKESADKPAGDFFSKDAKTCRYEHFTMGGGKLDAKMICGGGSGQATVVMSGDYSPTHYSMTMETIAATGGEAPMTMRMAVESNQVGACHGNEDGRS